MKMNQNVAAALLMGLAQGEFRFALRVNTQGSDRAPRGSALETERLAAAEAKRARKAARRASQSSGGDEHG